MSDCPICGEEVDASEALSDSGGEEAGLQVECPHCGATLDVDVEWEPVFTLRPAD